MAETDNNQMAFWEAMREKYERRNESLKQQEVCLRKRLEQLKQIMEKQNAKDDCDCVPEKLENPSLVQCLVEKGKKLLLGNCKCGDPKVGEEFLCACHIQDPEAPLNVDSKLCPMQELITPDGCLNPTCDFYDPTLAHLGDNPSTFSLKTTDIYYMDKLADLVQSEKIMQEKIDDLGKREHSYLTAIHEMQESMKKQSRAEPISKEFKKLTAGLEEENNKLRNDLEDLRLELKHCFERIEGPLKRNLEDQRNKCSKLESQLKDLQAKTKSKEDSYLREVNEVKAKLCQACCTMVDLSTTNSKLKEDLDSLQNNCANLEEELLNQRLKEAENILKFKNALSRRTPEKRIQEKGDDSEQDLGFIARKLGETLKEVCPCVSDVPSGLAETAENIRQLTELVREKGAQRRKKRKGDISQTPTSSGSEAIEIVTAPDTPSKSKNEIKEVDDCACSNSSLRLKPRIGKNQYKNAKHTQIGRSSSTSLEMKPTMKMKTSKETCTLEPTAPAKKTLSKGCTCCPAQNDCDYLQSNIQKVSIETLEHCLDVDTKKIGPSEEIIAVKNLGTLSMPPGETLIEAEVGNVASSTEPPKIEDEENIRPRRNKLVVDTTCDILDKSPEDIHVVTTITNTGSLEITTEGPPGIIETKINYLSEGKIEIVTKLVNHHNMERFISGTLLCIPEDAPDYDKSQTYDRQHDSTFAVASSLEIECNQSKTCGGLCDNEIKSETSQQNIVDKAETILNEKVTASLPCGQVVVNNNFIEIGGTQDPFMTREWKNSKFRVNPKEQASLQSMDFLSKPKGKRQDRIAVHSDITSEQEIFRLSGRQSLTHVEKFTTEDNIPITAGNFAFPELLDTISEGDEEQVDSNKSDKQIDAKKEEEEKTLDDSAGDSIVPTEHSAVVDVSDNRSEELERIDNEIVLQTHLQESTQVEPKDDNSRRQSAEIIMDLNSLPPPTELSTTLVPQDRNNFYLKINEESIKSQKNNPSSQESLISSRSVATFDGVSEINSDCQITESFLELSQNINCFTGKMTLKQSKSMYENRGSRSEYLRICKSASLSLGRLNIDLEVLKISKRIPNVGDFSGTGSGLSGQFSPNVQFEQIPVDRSKESPFHKDKIALEVLKGGYNPLASYSSISEHTYQCYVCHCSNKKDKNDDQQKNVPNSSKTQDLENRIDRLLEIDPLAECQCVDYTVPNVPPTDKPNRIQEECRCSRKQQGKVDNSRQSCWCNSNEKKSKPKLEVYEQQGDNVQHDENCTCVDCICNPCYFKKGASVCDCGKCECTPCCANNIQLTSLPGFGLNKPLQEITVMNFSVPCDCNEKCLCSPCMDESKKLERLSGEQSQPKPQAPVKSQKGNAQEASYKRCAHKVPGIQIEVPQKTDIVGGSSRLKTESQVGRPEISLPSTWKNVVGCACSPPSDDKKAVCDCRQCECKPCSYPEKGRKPCDCKPTNKEVKTNGSSGKCNCNLCTSEYCCSSSVGDAETDVVKKSTFYPSPSINCQCQLCECLFCSDPNARHATVTKHIEGAKQQGVLEGIPPTHQSNTCICAKCMCDPCVVLVENIGDSQGSKCDCNKCKCDPCSDINSWKHLKEVPPSEDNEQNRILKSDRIVSCDCSMCICHNCMGKPKETSVGEKNRNDSDGNALKQIEKDKKHKCECAIKSDVNEPVDCNDCFICCDTFIKEKPIKEEVENSSPPYKEKDVSKIACDCSGSCSCNPCPDPNVGMCIELQMIGDADRAKEELKNVLNKIGCSCDQVEDSMKPLVKQASNFETTISRMKMKLNNLQQKCKDKDQIIDAMTNELRIRSQSGVFEDLLHDLAHPKQKFTPDFTRAYVCDFLPKPRHKVGNKLQRKRSPLYRFDNTLEPILELDRYLPNTEQDTYGYTKNLDVSGMEIIDIRRVTIDSILIKWLGPPCINGVTGYQIFVNDELKYRVLSPNRTTAVIDTLDLSSSLEIMLFAITCYGRCEPPALATYRI